MTEMDELLPCPFCGSRDIATDGPSYTLFMCNDCGGQIYDQDSHAEAIAAWNRRPSLSPAGVMEEQVEAAAREISPHLWVELTHEQRMSDDYAFTNRRDAQERARKQARAALEAAAKAQPSFKQGRRMMPGYTDFDTWFHEQEGTSLRSERFTGDVKWLKAAFDAGRSAQPSISTGQGEPVAWMVSRPGNNGTAFPAFFPTEEAADSKAASVTVNPPARKAPLYTHPSLPAGHVAVPVERLTTVLDEYDAQTKALPLGHEDRTRGASSYNWRRSVVEDIRAMLAALPHNQGEGK